MVGSLVPALPRSRWSKSEIKSSKCRLTGSHEVQGLPSSVTGGGAYWPGERSTGPGSEAFKVPFWLTSGASDPCGSPPPVLASSVRSIWAGDCGSRNGCIAPTPEAGRAAACMPMGSLAGVFGAVGDRWGTRFAVSPGAPTSGGNTALLSFGGALARCPDDWREAPSAASVTSPLLPALSRASTKVLAGTERRAVEIPPGSRGSATRLRDVARTKDTPNP